MPMIKNIIKERANQFGITNGQLAEVANTSQSQISAFFNKDASLTVSSLDNIFNFLGIDISTYENRRQLAEKVAEILINEGMSEEDIIKMSKEKMSSIVDDESIMLLIDGIDDDDYERMQKKGSIIPVECTYVYFKSMVLQYVKLEGRKPTPKLVHSTYNSVGSILGYAVSGLFGGILGLGAYALYSYVTSDDDDESVKANTPLVSIAKKLLRY